MKSYKTYRNYDGTFRSYASVERQAVRTGYIMLTMFLFPFVFGIANIEWHGELYPAQVVEAAEPWTPQNDVCGLKSVICQDEEKVEKAILTIPHETDETERRIRHLYKQAEAAGLDPDQLARTIWCESQWFSVQSYIPGEESFGLSQIHLPSHPDVTREQALNPIFAIDWMIEKWENDIWYAYSREDCFCTNGLHEKEYWL